MQHLQTRNQQEGKTGRQDMADAPAYVDLDATLALSKNMKKEINENSEQCKLCNTCFLDAKSKRLIHTIIAGSKSRSISWGSRVNCRFQVRYGERLHILPCSKKRDRCRTLLRPLQSLFRCGLHCHSPRQRQSLLGCVGVVTLAGSSVPRRGKERRGSCRTCQIGIQIPHVVLPSPSFWCPFLGALGRRQSCLPQHR